MKNYYKTAAYKLISGFGGPGSIIEDVDGAFEIKQPKYWEYIDKNKHQNIENAVIDKRLLGRLKQKFSYLLGFYSIPINSPRLFAPYSPSKVQDIASSNRFPSFHYCPKCHRLRTVHQFCNEWGGSNNLADFKPKCGFCKKKDTQNRVIKRDDYYLLTQINFVFASKSGAMEEVPWPFWFKTMNADQQVIEEDTNTETGSKSAYPVSSTKCCENQDLRYQTSNQPGLEGVKLRCESCKRSESLGGLMGINFIDNGELFKVYQRATNSLYYPVVAYSLRLPTMGLLSDKGMIELLQDINLPDEELNESIIPIFKRENERRKPTLIELEQIRNELRNSIHLVSEQEYRRAEYRFFRDIDPSHVSRTGAPITVSRRDCSQILQLKSLLAITKLSMTTVQLGYTRIEPLSLDALLEDAAGDEPASDGPRFKVIETEISANPFGQKYLPAIVSFGEGIFLELDSEKIGNWLDQYIAIATNSTRLESLLERVSNMPYFLSWEISDSYALAKMLLLHTLSHLIIKELEFACGYPATSLRERIYAGLDMNGILIYAISGSEGTYGGLVSQAQSDKFKLLLDGVIIAANDCSADPICHESEDGGVGGLNLASCYACTLLPETSCELFNSILDRQIVIDFFNFTASA